MLINYYITTLPIIIKDIHAVQLTLNISHSFFWRKNGKCGIYEMRNCLHDYTNFFYFYHLPTKITDPRLF